MNQNSAILFKFIKFVEVGHPQGIDTSLTNQVSKDVSWPIDLFLYHTPCEYALYRLQCIYTCHLITANLRGCRSTKTCDLSFVRGMRGTIFSDLQVNVFQLVLVLFHNILVLSVKHFYFTILVNI